MIGVAGSVAPELSFAIAGSFQCVILPRKMSASTGPLRLSLAGAPFRLYEASVAPRAHGTWTQSLQAEPWAEGSGASLAPNYAVRALSFAIPTPGPIAP